MGIRMLLYLLKMTPAQLGVVPRPQISLGPGHQFEVVDVLGVGSFCSVYSARRKGDLTGQLFALKTTTYTKLERDKDGSGSVVAMLSAERQALRQLNDTLSRIA